jgi:hypothetical protein
MGGIKSFGTGEAFFFNKRMFFLIKKRTFTEISFIIDSQYLKCTNFYNMYCSFLDILYIKK